MQLHEITSVSKQGMTLNESIAIDILLNEGAKELFAKGKQAMGKAADALKDAADAPAQKAWAEIQSRLATAGKDGAIQQLKDFAGKHKVAIGTLAILGAGLLFSGDASAADVAQGAAQAADAGSGITPEKLIQYTMKDLVGTSFKGPSGLEKFTPEMAEKIMGSEFNGVPLVDYTADLLKKYPDNLKGIVDAVGKAVQHIKMSGLQTQFKG